MMRRGSPIWMVAAVGAAVAAFVIKYEVRSLEDELARLENELVDRREAIHVLRAEWSYLNRPDRLTELAERHLDLVPMAPAQMGVLVDVPYRPNGLPDYVLTPSISLVTFEATQ